MSFVNLRQVELLHLPRSTRSRLLAEAADKWSDAMSEQKHDDLARQLADLQRLHEQAALRWANAKKMLITRIEDLERELADGCTTAFEARSMHLPIDDVKQLAKRNHMDAVIVIAFRGDKYCTTSYGRDRATCEAFAKMCDQIHDDIAGGEIPIPIALFRNPT